MYTVSVRDHFMIAHSLRGELFGPAQRMHGATYVVDLELERPHLNNNGVVVDIGLATQALGEVLADFNYRNLDEDPAFAGRNTTTEFLAKTIYDRMAEKIRTGDLGEEASGIARMRVVLRESHVAWASFAAELES